MAKKDGAAAPKPPYHIAAETLRGDLRDLVLGFLKRAPKPWKQMRESEQRTAIREVETDCSDFLLEAVPAIQARNHAHVVCRVDKVTIDDRGTKLTISGAKSSDAVLDAAHLQGKLVVIIMADAQQHMGEQAPAEITRDQPDMLEAGSKLNVMP